MWEMNGMKFKWMAFIRRLSTFSFIHRQNDEEIFFFFSFRRSFSILDSLMGKRVLYYVWFTINNRRWLHVYFIIVFNVIQWILFAFSKLKKKIFQSITTIIWQHKAAVIRYILYSLTSKHANKPLAIYVHYLCNVRCICLRKSNLISMSI